MKRIRKVLPIFGLTLILVAFLSAFTCDKSHAAADAVHKYAVSLDSFQQAEIKEHNNGKVDDGTHLAIQRAVKFASESGKNLDQGILVASKGADASQYIQQAQHSFDDLIGLIRFEDPNTPNTLKLLVKGSSDLLQNAITLIKQVKGQNAPAPSGTLLFWLSLPMLGLAATVTGATAALALVAQLLELEPVAFQFVVNMVESMKGKTTEEIVAMNEEIFGRVSDTADAEIAATEAKKKLP